MNRANGDSTIPFAASLNSRAPPIGEQNLILHQTSRVIVKASQFLLRTVRRTGAAIALLVAFFVVVPSHAASNLSTGEVATGEMGDPAAATLIGQKYTLNLHHLHTNESLSVVYRVGDTYLPAAMEKLNFFLRDHRTQDESHYDPKEFDLLHNLLTRLHRPNAVVDIVCGYRTPWSNNFLRTRSANTGVAKNSQHTLAKAIDIRIPGVATRKLRDIALSLQAGGVGYYPVSQFVHVDVGPVRKWTFRGGGDD